MRVFVSAILALVLLSVPVLAYDGELVFVPHEFHLYAEASFSADVVGRFSPQTVEIRLRGDDYWVLTEIDGALGWMNLLASPAMCKLDAFSSRLASNVAVLYRNLDTGFTFMHNPERGFFAASLSKLTHAFYVFQLAERGYLDMYEVHVYSPRDEWGGTGVLRFESFGIELTTRDLLGLSIRESDNAAFRMLIRHTANAPLSYHDFVAEIGAQTRNIRDIFAQNTNPRDALVFMQAIFDYIEGDGNYAHYLRYDLLNTALTSHPHFTRWEGSNGWGDDGAGTDVNVEMLLADYPIARKYGWSGGAFHDAGIIYAPSPYILVVLTNMERGAHDLFADISHFVQTFNRRTFTASAPLDAPALGPAPCDGEFIRVANQPGGFWLTVPVFAEDIDPDAIPVFLDLRDDTPPDEPPPERTKNIYKIRSGIK